MDYNLYSFNGPADNGRTVVLGDIDASGVDAQGNRYSSALKFSTSLKDFTLIVGDVIGGKDACIDINNSCDGVEITAKSLTPTGEFVATVKGNSQNVKIHCDDVRSKGSVVDVIGGDWSDQSHLYVLKWVLDLARKSGGTISVWCLAALKPTELRGPYKYNFPHPDAFYHDFIVWCFETLRRWGFFHSSAN